MEDKALITKQKKRAEVIPTDWLECRLTGHWWALEDAHSQEGGGVAMSYKCHRCTTTRSDVIAPRYGELLERGYRYPEGYLVKQVTPGERTFSAAALRADTWRRAS
jgi:hypothetical protein